MCDAGLITRRYRYVAPPELEEVGGGLCLPIWHPYGVCREDGMPLSSPVGTAYR